MLRMVVIAGVMLAALSAQAQKADVPVTVERLMLGGKLDAYLVTLGQVHVPKGGKDGFVSVRGGPATDHAEKDRLTDQSYVLTLPGKPGWLQVIYPDPARAAEAIDLEAACGIDNPPQASAPRKAPYAGPCRWGWASERFIKRLTD